MAGLSGTVTNIKVGAHIVKFGASGSETDLGFTKDGSEITYTPTYVDIMVDQLGKTLVDKKLSGEEVKVKINLMEFTTANLLRAIPAAASAASGMDIGRRAGLSLATGASGVLILHPVELLTADKSRDWTIPLAVVTSPTTLPFKVDAETVISLEFTALAKTGNDDTKHLLRYGY